MANGRTAAEVIGNLELTDAARLLLTPGISAEAFFDVLVKAGEFPDAIRYTARLMSKPQAVWWGCLCVWHAGRPAADTPGGAALKAVVEWLQAPDEPHRRAAESAGNAAGPTAPAGMLATAAFMSGGSISVPGQPEVPAEPHFTAALAGSAVLAASRAGPPAGMRERQKTFLALAVDVYRGKNSWTANGTRG